MRWLLPACLIAMFAFPTLASAEDRPPEDVSFWMQKKLELSQKIFAALASEDFTAIRESATTMGKLNSVEKFVRGRNADYRAQLEIFRYANASLVRSADQESLAGTALAFNQLTLSCVNCHQQLRDAKK